MGSNICGCNNTPNKDEETNVVYIIIYKFKYIFNSLVQQNKNKKSAI